MINRKSNIHAPVLLSLLNLLRKGDKTLRKSRILILFPTCFINLIIREHSCITWADRNYC